MNNKEFREVKDTIEENYYLSALENFLRTNGEDLTPELKEKIRQDPDRYVLFSNSEDGLEVTLKDPDTSEKV